MKKIFFIAAMMLITLASCSSSDDSIEMPKFSEISISPEQASYKVGDQITLTVTQLTETSSDIKAEKVWFFYPDGETQADRIKFVTRAADTNEYTTTFTLKAAGQVELSFWTQYDLPKYKYDGVTLYKTITVTE
ncbi:MAG: hypothetical protein Q4F34_03370 [Prevotellaceae bacterium]|nr:hypothetical protein [Prevotellaceae bacterium]